MTRAGASAGPLILVCLLLGAFATHQGVISAQIYDWGFAAAMAVTLWSLLPRAGVPSAWAGPVAVAAGLAAVGGRAIWPQIQLAPYLAIFLINLGTGYLFARGLMPGRTPLLLQLIALMQAGPPGDAAFHRFVRNQCALWAVFGFASAIAGGAAMISPWARETIGTYIFYGIAFQVVWFVVTHHYASWRHGRTETWVLTVRTMARPATWRMIDL